jgi:hypothetical protein
MQASVYAPLMVIPPNETALLATIILIDGQRSRRLKMNLTNWSAKAFAFIRQFAA